MSKITRRTFALAATLALAACAGSTTPEEKASTRARLNSEASAALAQLRTESPVADELAGKAKGILVMPSILKGGLGITGESGDGVLYVDGTPSAYYNVSSAGIGLAIGVQNYSQALMFMDDESLANFQNSQGWKAGVDGSVTLVEAGAGGDLDTDNITKPVVGFVFGQSGLMANVSIEGSKYTRIED
ncbi:MAG: hypothetical protein KDH19_08970 [Geminicoccaceae bacterium]|nr:hypothetical protein [Geminicoccaceae bacterium]MCB2011337.1 hypothetical protein [Geminicoccaceae bacterium]